MTKKAENKQSKSSWFKKIPRQFFRFPIWIFSIYVGIGYLIAGILHLQIWLNGNQVETVFTNFGLHVNRPTPKFAMMLFTLTSIIVVWLYYRLLRRVELEAGNVELAFWGTTISFLLSWTPWLYASSFVTTMFVFLNGMNAIIGFGMKQMLSIDERAFKKHTKFDPWKMFVNATKSCVAILAILLGAVATGALFPWRVSKVEGAELFRYIFLCAYVVVGMLFFILLPLLARCLEQGATDEVSLELPGPI